ncbi:translation initiation factor IF-2-like [Onychomys torridus]|uniref:translation initiation factor IF-2-like n=1 Tax=Onychomys torridus TaxID=38674 RepID=UPI00167F9A7D|nr:translation initiation factor IF-2-like [Onychomys torridus]
MHPKESFNKRTAGAAAADLPPVEGRRGAKLQAGERRRVRGGAEGRGLRAARAAALRARRPARGARFRRARRGRRRVAAARWRLRSGHGTPAGGRERDPAPRLGAPRPQLALRRGPGAGRWRDSWGAPLVEPREAGRPGGTGAIRGLPGRGPGCRGGGCSCRLLAG